MPKTHGNLAERIYSFENLDAAFNEMSKGMRYTNSVLRYKENYEENIINLQNHLIWQSYQVRPYREFTIYEPKMRKISAPDIEDRLVQHALCRVVEPFFERRFIYSNFACRKGKGMLAACKRVQKYIRQQPEGKPVYYLRMDFHKYFHSISHVVLKRLIRRVIRDTWALWLWDTIIDSYPQGLPIGALTSQLLANIVGDALDHYLCDECGATCYARYMDDIIIVSSDLERLEQIFGKARFYSQEILWLTLNENKSHIAVAEYPYEDGRKTFDPGIDFAGYGIHRRYLSPRKRNVKAAKKRHRKLARLVSEGQIHEEKLLASVNSFAGYMQHCVWTKDAYRALDEAILSLDDRRIRA